MAANDTKISIRIPRELHKELVDLAAKDRRSVNQQIVVLLEQATRARANEKANDADQLVGGSLRN